jgi:hypothetical protein
MRSLGSTSRLNQYWRATGLFAGIVLVLSSMNLRLIIESARARHGRLDGRLSVGGLQPLDDDDDLASRVCRS